METNAHSHPNAKLLAKLRDESEVLSYDSDELNSRLIAYENDDIEYDPSVERPLLEIIDDARIAVNGVKINLSPAKIFAMNALRLSQGYGQTGQELRDLGFKGDVSTFNSAIFQLVRDLHEASGAPIVDVYRDGRGHARKNTYELLPEVEIIDTRATDPAERKEAFLHECVYRDDTGTVTRQENGSLAFLAPLKRIGATKLMLEDFRVAADADNQFTRLFAAVGSRNMSVRLIQQLSNLPRLTRDEEAVLLERKEQALARYLDRTHEFSDDDKQHIIAGVNATYELFARNLDLVSFLAHKYCTSRVPYHELYQEGAAQLFEAVLAQQYFSDASQNFRHIAEKNIRSNKGRGIHILRFQEPLAPVRLPREFHVFRHTVREARGALKDTLGRWPTLKEISEHTSYPLEKVMSIISVDSEMVHLDEEPDEDSGDQTAEWLVEGTFVDRELQRIEQEEAIDTLFYSAALTDAEKVLISIHFQIFHPSLCGAEMRTKNGVTFTYPFSEEDFNDILSKGYSITSMSYDLLGRGSEYARQRLQRALHKSRRVLENSDSFDSSKYSPYVDQEPLEQIEREKEDMVIWAKEVSPERKIGTKELRDIIKRGKTLYSETRIIDLFGSFIAFHEACGFEPDKGELAKRMSIGEIAALALDIRPDAPLSTPEIATLAKHGEFVSLATIYGKFGSVPKFQEFCRAEIARRAINN